MRALFSAMVLLAGLCAATPLRAQVPAPPEAETCTVPIYLLVGDNKLSKVADEVKQRQTLDILVIGSRSALLAGPDGPTVSFPARLEAALRERLPGITVNVSTDLKPKTPAGEMISGFATTVAERRPALVIWQTGTVDAIRSTDTDDFRKALSDGIAALQKGGSDVVMMNPQYSPRIESILSVTPYNDTIRVVAQENGVPVFDRFSIMRHWSEAGDFDLFGPAHGLAMAKRVHDCIGRALSGLIVEAAQIKRAELGIR